MKKTRTTLTALSVAALLGITACGSGDDPDNPDDTVSVTTDSSSQDTSAGESADDSASESSTESATTGSGSDDGGLASVREAIEAAEKETGGTAYEVDDQDEDGTWEIDVAKGKQSIEVEVAEDGSTRTDDDDDLDDEDRDGIRAAKVTIGDAIKAALDEVDGTFDDAELEDDDGKHYWEVSVDDVDGRDDVQVKVDVTDGSVISVDDD